MPAYRMLTVWKHPGETDRPGTDATVLGVALRWHVGDEPVPVADGEWHSVYPIADGEPVEPLLQEIVAAARLTAGDSEAP
jgi:hypothetical protein